MEFQGLNILLLKLLFARGWARLLENKRAEVACRHGSDPIVNRFVLGSHLAPGDARSSSQPLVCANHLFKPRGARHENAICAVLSDQPPGQSNASRPEDKNKAMCIRNVLARTVWQHLPPRSAQNNSKRPKALHIRSKVSIDG